jgi:signal transduction histidine kinase
MRERLGPFGGKLNINSNSSGTQISVTIPIAETAENETGSEPAHAVA